MTKPGAVVSHLVCDLTLRHRLCDPYPQITSYRATFRLCLDAGLEAEVGSAGIVVLPRWDQATFEALDDQTWDLAAFGRLLGRGYYEILTELRGEDPRAGRGAGTATMPGVVLVDQVGVDVSWRGLQLGLVGTGLALRALRRDAAFAVLYPMQPGLGAHAERNASRHSLTRYWGRLGFTHRYEGYLVLDLTGNDLDAGLGELTRTSRRLAPTHLDAARVGTVRVADSRPGQAGRTGQDAPRTIALG
jgi:hypothetical protein